MEIWRLAWWAWGHLFAECIVSDTLDLFLQMSLLVVVFEPLLCSLDKSSINHRAGICDLTKEAF